MKKEDLLKIIGEDELGLLQNRPIVSIITADQRLISSFEEINHFIQENSREPEVGNGVQEHKLATRLQSIRSDNKKREALMDIDQYCLLNIKHNAVNSLNDIIQNDTLGILDNDSQDIFTLKHIPKETTMPDYVARRKPCKDFEKFESLFLMCQSELTAGKRKLQPFTKEQEIDKGYFFVLKGILLYIANIGKRETKKGKLNARLRCIFENGTESDMLLRSLSAELYKDGKRVTAHEDSHLNNFMAISEDDKEAGYLYILKSLSNKPEIQSIKHLYKIGFSTIPVEERIKNAKLEPTYLMAPVSIVSEYKCYNMNTQKLELLLHIFFGNSCLNIDVFDHDGNRHIPREWFVAPLPVIDQALKLLMNGEIIHYKYDPNLQEILLKS